jgi:hypothetical protein
MLILVIIKSALVATTNHLTLLAISPPHVASHEAGDRIVQDTTSPERMLATRHTRWMDGAAVLGLTAYEVWSLRQGNRSSIGLAARLGELGLGLSLVGAILRLRCYQVLGRFFTFKVGYAIQWCHFPTSCLTDPLLRTGIDP